MSIQRNRLYRFPWSRTDNPGGWIEVTDTCNLSCPGCYRYSLTGHSPVEKIKADILKLKELVNCDGIGIAGGEPLLYPDLVEVVEFITRHGLKARLLTNGETLTWELARDLKKAGLSQISFHVDCNQMRPGWEGKTEAETNELRQHYADMIWELKGINCGFLVTIYQTTVEYIPDVLAWSRRNIHKVQHLALVALRGMPLSDGIEYMVNGERIDISDLRVAYTDLDEICTTSEEINEIIEQQYPDCHPSAYLNGTARQETYKVLVTPLLGTRNTLLGTVGARGVEFTQTMYHLRKNRYPLGRDKPDIGKRVFLLSLIDRETRQCLINYLKTGLRNPPRLLDRLYMQSIHIQQPREITSGEVNKCDGCPNQMIYQGKLIHSCLLDEYRMFGGPLVPLQTGVSQ